MKGQGLVVLAGDPLGDSVSVPMDLRPVGVVFFPSLPSMGVVLFLSFVLGNASREGGTLFVPLFPFSPLLPLSLLSSLSSFSHSLFLLFLFFRISFSFPFAHSLPSFPSLSSPSPSFSVSFPLHFSLLRFFFFFEGTACTVCFQDVRNDATDCNQLYLYCNKEIFYFLNLEFCAF